MTTEGPVRVPLLQPRQWLFSGKSLEGRSRKSVRGGRNVEYVDSAKGKAVLAALDDVAGETQASLATVALAWTKAQGGVTAPIASATSLEQAKELIAALTLELLPGQIEKLNRASEV